MRDARHRLARGDWIVCTHKTFGAYYGWASDGTRVSAHLLGELVRTGLVCPSGDGLLSEISQTYRANRT